MVRAVRNDLHTGDPYAPLLQSKSNTGGRNNKGRITPRHRGGGHNAIRTGLPVGSSGLNMTLTEALFLHWCCTAMVSDDTFWRQGGARRATPFSREAMHRSDPVMRYRSRVFPWVHSCIASK